MLVCVQDEAVVAEVLRQCNPPGKPTALKLVDCSSYFPQLKRGEGLSSWKVAVEQEVRESNRDRSVRATRGAEGGAGSERCGARGQGREY